MNRVAFSFIECPFCLNSHFLLRCSVSGKKWIAHDYEYPCTKAEKFGMYIGQPCVSVKLNKVYGWEPEPYYNITEVIKIMVF